MHTVIFARHGESQANKDGLLAGAKTDSPLTEAGREHAHELANLLIGRRIDLIVTSPLSRASSTATVVADVIGYTGEIIEEPLFIERDVGSATGKPRAEAHAMLDDGTVTGAESIPDLADRAQRAKEWLNKRPEKYILVVSHAAFGQMFGTVVAGVRPEEFRSFSHLSNGGTFELTLE